MANPGTAPSVPTPTLRNWITEDYSEPCSRCGGGHTGREKYVCSHCDRLFCAGTSRQIKDGTRFHVVGYREGDKIHKSRCGPLDDCGTWDEIAPKLKKIVDDLE